MSSTKKPADKKRASLPRSADYANSFVKDFSVEELQWLMERFKILQRLVEQACRERLEQ